MIESKMGKAVGWRILQAQKKPLQKRRLFLVLTILGLKAQAVIFLFKLRDPPACVKQACASAIPCRMR